MAEKIKGERYNLTEPVPMIHPNVMVARKFKKDGKEQGDAKFDATFMFKLDSKDLLEIKKAQMATARAKWPDRDFKDPERPFRWVHKDGNKWADRRKEKGKDGEYARGYVLLTARSKYDVGLAGLENGKIVDYDNEAIRAANAKKFYSGVLSLASFTFVPFAGELQDGLTCYLNSVLSLNKGPKIGSSAPSAAETFKGYIGSAVAENPMGDDMGDDF